MQILARRQMLGLLGGALSTTMCQGAARAGSYPDHPVRIIVPFPPGGVTDIVARLVGQRLAERLGQPFVIENRAGAGGSIGTESVVRAPADGHTLLLCGAYNAIYAAIYPGLSFDFARDIAPVAGVMRTFYVVVAHPDVPTATIPELITYAKANPRKLNMASGGNGSPHHMAGALFQMATGTVMTHVPYRGAAPAVNDLIAGHVQIMFDNLTSSIEHVRAGKLRALAVTSTERSDLLPGIPTVAEDVAGYEATGWIGFAAPKGTPDSIVEFLHSSVSSILDEPAMRNRIAELGGVPIAASRSDFGRSILDDLRKWASVAAHAGIKLE